MTTPLDPPPGFTGQFTTAPSELERFAGASGILHISPAAVAAPHDSDDLRRLVHWAAHDNLTLIPRGAGTGRPGGNVGRGIAVDLVSGFRGVHPVDPDSQTVHVEPGVTLSELNRNCAPAGLHFPVDPSSSDRCTIGGMIANNSAGAHSVKYGATREWVRSLDLVLADGQQVTISRGERSPEPLATIVEEIDADILPVREKIRLHWPNVRKNSSGYALKEYLESGDALDLVIGSEGTLALIVGATLRLSPIPARRAVALLEFADLAALGDAVQALLPLAPATCEFLDRTFLEMVRLHGADSGYPLRPGLEGILLVEVEGDSPGAVDDDLQAITSRMTGLADRISTATDPDRQMAFWAVRHAASPIIAERADGRISMQFIEDSVVPLHNLPAYIRELREVLASHDLPAVIFGHAGDGNLHVNPLVDISEAGWRETLETVLYRIADIVADLGGTLSGEHGDGRLRAPLLERIWGPPMVAHFRVVKHAFDPLATLNPGVILPETGQRPLSEIRAYGGRHLELSD